MLETIVEYKTIIKMYSVKDNIKLKIKSNYSVSVIGVSAFTYFLTCLNATPTVDFDYCDEKGLKHVIFNCKENNIDNYIYNIHKSIKNSQRIESSQSNLYFQYGSFSVPRKQNYDLMFILYEENNCLYFEIKFKENYENVYIESYVFAFKEIIKGLFSKSNLSDINYASKDDINLITRINKEAICKREIDILDFLEKSIRKYPEKVFIKSEHESFTFFEVAVLSRQISDILNQHNIKSGDVVSFFTLNRLWSYIGFFASLINNNVYLFLNAKDTKKRIKHFLNKTKPKAVVVCKSSKKIIEPIIKELRFKIDIIQLDPEYVYKQSLRISRNFKLNYKKTNSSSNVYLTYSDLLDKFLGITRNKLSITSEWYLKFNNIDERSCYLLSDVIPFVFQLIIICSCLIGGSSIHVADINCFVNYHSIKEQFLRNNITHCLLPNYMLNISQVKLADKLDCLALLGNSMPPKIERNNISNKIVYLFYTNFYSIFLTGVELYKNKNDNILGKLCPNKSVAILDNNKTPVPLGAIGELYVSDFGSEYMPTGVLARLYHNGNLVYICRKDEKFKYSRKGEFAANNTQYLTYSYSYVNYLDNEHFSRPLLYGNNPMVFELSNVSVDNFIKAFNKLLEIHPGLGIRFLYRNGDLFFRKSSCRINNSIVKKLDVDFNWSEIKNHINTFDWFEENLFRVKLYYCEDQLFCFLDFHAAICDFYSINIIVRDLLMLLDGVKPPNEKISIFDISEKENKLFTRSYVNKCSKYYSDVFSNYHFNLKFLDKKVSGEHTSIEKDIRIDIVEKIKQKLSVEKFAIASLMKVCSLYTGMKNVLIGYKDDCRDDSDLENTVAAVYNYFPIFAKVEKDTSLMDLYKKVNKQFDLYNSGDYSIPWKHYDKFIYDIFEPNFIIFFNHYDISEVVKKYNPKNFTFNLNYIPYKVEKIPAYIVDVNMILTNQGYRIQVNYNDGFFDSNKVEKFFDKFLSFIVGAAGE